MHTLAGSFESLPRTDLHNYMQQPWPKKSLAQVGSKPWCRCLQDGPEAQLLQLTKLGGSMTVTLRNTAQHGAAEAVLLKGSTWDTDPAEG